MSPQRLLLIHNDRTLATCFGEKFAALGIAVEVAIDGESALRRLSGEPSLDLVVLDLVLPTMEGVEILRTIRRIDVMRDLPVVTVPGPSGSLNKAARQAGATHTPANSEPPVPALLGAVAQVLKIDLQLVAEESQLEAAWIERLRAEAPAALGLVRRDLHSVVHDQGGRKALRDLYQHAHHFTQFARLMQHNTLAAISAALEALAADLYKLPEQVNPSTLRTLGQTADFLAQLLEAPDSAVAKDLGSARILVVEDDAAAGELIQAALQYVGLKAVWVDSPTTSLEMLGRESFELIFLDVGLPQMSGFDLCSRIRTLELHEKTPIVFLTGMATFQNRVQSSLSGGNDFIGKPFNVPELGLKAMLWVYKGQLTPA
jgi:DNA-binding response OmpR family regulator